MSDPWSNSSAGTPEPPAGLQHGGQRLWSATLSAFELAEHEQIILREACRTVDLLDQLQRSIDEDGPVVRWGDGARANPAAVEARQHRIALARLIASLGIPSDQGEPAAGPRRGSRGGARGVYDMGGAA